MYQNFIKRIIDIIISLALFPLVLLISLCVGIAIKIEDRGRIFYTSTRLGQEMIPFQMHKLRSMKEDAKDVRNPDGTTFNSKDDQRVTKVGKFIRRTSLDELPQIFNVLKGEMSLIGPRPSPLGDKSIYPSDFFSKFKVKPGITGYSQAIVRNNAKMDERITLDKYYVENVSLILDIKIIFLTFKSVILRKNINRN